MTFNIDTSRSYATEQAALWAVQKRFGRETKVVIVCNRQGRFTPIFPKSMLGDIPMFAVASAGFMVIG
jgi:hypothetical protein